MQMIQTEDSGTQYENWSNVDMATKRKELERMLKFQYGPHRDAAHPLPPLPPPAPASPPNGDIIHTAVDMKTEQRYVFSPRIILLKVAVMRFKCNDNYNAREFAIAMGWRLEGTVSSVRMGTVMKFSQNCR